MASAGIDERECLKCPAPGRIGSEGTRIQAARHSTAAAAKTHTAHTQQRGQFYIPHSCDLVCREIAGDDNSVQQCSGADTREVQRALGGARTRVPLRFQERERR